MDATSKVAAEGQSFPLGMAALAWLMPIGFGMWPAIHLGFHSDTAGIPDAIWFAWFGAIIGVFVAGASLLLIRLRARGGLPIAARSTAKYLALTLIAVTVVATAAIMVSR